MAVLERRFEAKKAVLVIASYYFYAQWDWRFCFLLAASTTISYVAGLLIGGSDDPRRRRLVLTIGVALHLTILGIFKYLDFLVLWLEQHNARSVRDLCGDAAERAILSVIKNPASYDPNKLTLIGYL